MEVRRILTDPRRASSRQVIRRRLLTSNRQERRLAMKAVGHRQFKRAQYAQNYPDYARKHPVWCLPGEAW